MTTLRYKHGLLIFALTFSFSCNPKQTSDANVVNAADSTNNFFGDDGLPRFGLNTKLILSAHFSECGEWGGHDEKIIIYKKENREFYLDYEKYKVDCDSTNPNDGSPVQQFEIKKTLSVNQKEKKSITDYIQRMIKSKIDEHFPGHAGNSFSVFLSDSTLLINVYDRKDFDKKSYNTLLTDLNLPIISNK